MERLNYNHLYYFYVVAKLGSIKEASEKLHVSQPTISDQLKLLEDFFQCKLFDRRNRSLILNQEGKLALEYAEKIFSLGNEATAQLRGKFHLPKQTLDIGISLSMSPFFVYEKLLPLFNNNDVTIKVQEGERHYLLADLEEGKLDIVFTDSKDLLPSTTNAYRVGVNKTFAVAHKKFLKHKKGFPSSLNEIPFFSYSNSSSIRSELELFFTKHAIAPKVIGEADDIELLQMMTEKGMAFTVVPEVAKNRICKNKDVIILGELKELQTSVWGIIKNNYKGQALDLLKSLD
ncbi:transcriptional regulator, LysR family [Bacteriovorax sp. BSW11_IV]|uniref:LysR family transcriptional regulator n=1 Tax=Bacteriovorax sp. BSW11_IV TaxID=1353529 RepID=UPI00038A2A76|nr:LysR family transcriptional regulator [Bacteriovorax sp. BSW11_IV]EQC50153.1 transcriptional regulator, LysR family [Bacteriovorax sp. BSW11_IV]